MSKVTARQKVAALKASMMAERMLMYCGFDNKDDLQNSIIDEEFIGDEFVFRSWEKIVAANTDTEAFNHFWSNE